MHYTNLILTKDTKSCKLRDLTLIERHLLFMIGNIIHLDYFSEFDNLRISQNIIHKNTILMNDILLDLSN